MLDLCKSRKDTAKDCPCIEFNGQSLEVVDKFLSWRKQEFEEIHLTAQTDGVSLRIYYLC